MTNYFKHRWESGLGLNASKRIIKTFKNGQKVTPEISPFGSIDSRIDLRGFIFPDMIKINNLRLNNADLSYASLRIAWIEKCSFTNTIFEGTNLTNARDIENNFTKCKFIKTLFLGAGLGYDGTTYNNCIFEKSDFRKTIFSRAEINDCVFSNCLLKGIDFNASSFENCDFIGKLEDIWFKGGFQLHSIEKEFGRPRKNRMRNVSFAKAKLYKLTFSNDCDLSTVTLPEEGNYRLYNFWRKRLESLKKEALYWPSTERNGAIIFADASLIHAKKQDWYIINVDNVIEWTNEKTANRIIDFLDNFELF